VKIYITKPTNYRVKLLVNTGVSAAPVNSFGRMVKDEQVVARNLIVEQQHPTAGQIHVVGVPVKFSDTPGGVRTPAPLLGEHSDKVLSGLGYGVEIESLRRSGVT